MPANYIVINSRFKPFSYAEMLQPIQMATLAHQEVENEYAELAIKANIWDKMANEQTDPYAYNMYKTYSNDLEEQANQLAREGLTPASRQNMLKMKQRYSSDIIPIEQAYKRRQELADEQRKILAKDNTMMFDRDASMLSLDDLIKNPQLTYQSYSGSLLTKQVNDAAKNLVRVMRNNPREWRSILGNQYFETIMQTGYMPEEIVQVLQGNPNTAPILNQIIEDAVKSSNIASWKDPSTLKRAYDYAGQGLWSGIGETQYQTLSNKAYDAYIQGSRRGYSDPIGSAYPHIRLQHTMTPKTRNKAALKLDELIKNGYITKDGNGNYKSTKKGFDEYFGQAPKVVTGSIKDGTLQTIGGGSTEFNRELNSLIKSAGFDPITSRNRDNYTFDDYINMVAHSIEDPYASADAYRNSDFVYDLSNSDQTALKDIILQSMRGVPLNQVEYNGTEYEDTGITMSPEFLNKEKVSPLSIVFGINGVFVDMLGEDGHSTRFRLPADVNTTIVKDLTDNAKEMKILLNAIQKAEESGKAEDAEVLRREYQSILAESESVISQLTVRNKTEEQKHKVTGYYGY